MENRSRRRLHLLFWVVGLAGLFAIYASGLRVNPPGFYLDESAHAYNSYLVARTGAGEAGPHFPLFFQYYAAGFTQYVDCVQIYLLAAVFRILPPSILLARMVCALWMFGACVLLGLLASRSSGRRTIGVIVAAFAFLTPWFFEGRGLVLEQQFVPLALALFLLIAHHVQAKENWSWRDIAKLVAALALVTYSYSTSLLGPLLALGLLFFATTQQRLVGVIKTGLVYGATLLPLLVFNRSHPGVLAKRLGDISYIKPGAAWGDVAAQFIKRYLEDQSLYGLLVSGDIYPRHHVPGSGGAFFFATFILAVMGLVVIMVRRRGDAWCRFLLYGLVVAVVPGAISNTPFNEMRLMAYPVFLLLLTVPALEWLIAPVKQASELGSAAFSPSGESLPEEVPPAGPAIAEGTLPRSTRLLILCALLALLAVEFYRFQTVFRRDGPNRPAEFDTVYKSAYDAAIKQPVRPIYLEDGKGGPAYVHAFWYATVEKRPVSEFVHLAPGAKAPAGKVVISTAEACQQCESILTAGVYRVYKQL